MQFAGWCGHVSGPCRGLVIRRWPRCLSRGSGPDHLLAIEVHRPKWIFLIRRFQPALCISSCLPFPTSATPCPAPDLLCVRAERFSQKKDQYDIHRHTARIPISRSAQESGIDPCCEPYCPSGKKQSRCRYLRARSHKRKLSKGTSGAAGGMSISIIGKDQTTGRETSTNQAQNLLK